MLYRGTAALEVWARRSVAGMVEVANLAEDWRDGRSVFNRERNLVMASFHFINRYYHQGFPGSVAPPPARNGGLEHDGGGRHRH